MVRLEEVDDEELNQQQEGPMGGEDDWDTDSGMIHSISQPPYLLTTSKPLHTNLTNLPQRAPPLKPP